MYKPLPPIDEPLSDLEDLLQSEQNDKTKRRFHLPRTEAPGVFVLDLEMPQGSGPEVASHLREEDTPTRILALSAHESESHVEKLLEAGASGYLTKDQAPERVAEAVRAVAGGAERWFVRPPRPGETPSEDPLETLTDRERGFLKQETVSYGGDSSYSRGVHGAEQSTHQLRVETESGNENASDT